MRFGVGLGCLWLTRGLVTSHRLWLLHRRGTCTKGFTKQAAQDQDVALL